MSMNPRLASALSFLSPVQDNVIDHEAKTSDGSTVAKQLPSSKLALPGHLLLAAVYVFAVLAYFIFSIVMFIGRPEVETFSQEPTSNYPTFPVKLQISCSNPPFCGNITVKTNYSSIPECQGIPDSKLDFGKTGGVANALLCFTPDDVFTTTTKAELLVGGVTVDFTDINPGQVSPTDHTPAPEMKASAVVTITGDAVGKDAASKRPLSRVINMDTWQVKTFIVGVTVHKDGNDLAQEAYPIAIQYEGKRPNWRATLMIRTSHFTNVYETSRPGDFVTVLASVGGASSIVWAFLLIVSPLVAFLLPGDNVTPSEK